MASEHISVEQRGAAEQPLEVAMRHAHMMMRDACALTMSPTD